MVGKKQKSPTFLKIHLDQIFSFYSFNVCCHFFVFHLLQNAPMYRRNAQVWSKKGESYILPQRPCSDQLLTFSFSQRNKRTERESTNPSYQFATQGDTFPYRVLILFSFHCILLSFKKQALLKKTREGYIKRIYRQSLGNSLAKL